MAIPEDWTPVHREDDDELLGWLRPEGDGVVPVDRVGRDRAAASDEDSAARVLVELGLGWLADPWTLAIEGRPVRVRLVEVSPARIRVQGDTFNDMTRRADEWELPFPAPEELQPRR